MCYPSGLLETRHILTSLLGCVDLMKLRYRAVRPQDHHPLHRPSLESALRVNANASKSDSPNNTYLQWLAPIILKKRLSLLW